MCGIVGIVRHDSTGVGDIVELGALMCRRLQHRGPDGEGCWVSSDGRVFLGHRRLAIVDLSPSGRQPMVSATGRYTVVFNGEIYNHQVLRTSLKSKGCSFRGTSDTEVMLSAIEHWGLHEAIERFVGMFALGLWDETEKTISFARDRMGEKPLYVQHTDIGLAFSSEVRPLLMSTRQLPEVDLNSVGLLMRYGYVPDPHCIIKGTRKLSPATIETWRLGDRGIAHIGTRRYWHPTQALSPKFKDRGDAIRKIEDTLSSAIADQRVADVNVGSLLSGGIDSTVVTALMQKVHDTPVKTFCVNFGRADYNEGPYAQKVATHLRTDHLDVRVSEDELLQVVYRLASVYDEPFADSSQIPTVVVSQVARRHVTVALTGDGGDELFGGYNRYYWPAKIRSRASVLPAIVRIAGGHSLRLGSRWLPEWGVKFGQRVLGGANPIQDLRGKMAKAGMVLVSGDHADVYTQLISRWQRPQEIVPGWVGPDDIGDRLKRQVTELGEFQGQTLWDLETYLPGDNLVKVDRGSMSASLELRAPLLDHRVCELARQVILQFGFSSFAQQSKWPLREILARHVPSSLTDRPKMGFSVPLAHWLRTSLRAWASTIIAGAEDSGAGFINSGVLQTLWRQHVFHGEDHSARLWPVLMYLQWIEQVYCRRGNDGRY